MAGNSKAMKALRHILWGWGWLERQREFWRVFALFALHLPLETNPDRSSYSNTPKSHYKPQPELLLGEGESP